MSPFNSNGAWLGAMQRSLLHRNRRELDVLSFRVDQLLLRIEFLPRHGRLHRNLLALSQALFDELEAA